MSQRLFFGLPLDDEARAALAAAIERARGKGVLVPPLRVLDPASFHITLKFLGSVQDEQVAPIVEACSAAVAARSRFSIELRAAGAFPKVRRARVVTLGVSSGHAEVEALARAIDAATEPLGFPREQRAFHAHVTWARAKPDSDARALLAAFEMPAVRMLVREAVLFRSQLGAAGARYEAIACFPLQ